MTSSLVGSEMCIRDSSGGAEPGGGGCVGGGPAGIAPAGHAGEGPHSVGGCLLYTSDAADDM
eukprot:3440612-Prorocentrum_lima.AAC.1